jgi:enoyl-[acyl-carrier protein] reductase I
MIQPLYGKKGLIVGVANEDSIAWGCAKSIYEQGAEVALTYLNDKTKSNVIELSRQIDSSICMPLDVTNDEQINAVFSRIQDVWGHLDFLIHSVAFCPEQDLHRPVVECSSEGFHIAMDVSCYSLIRLTRAATPLMFNGGSVIAMSYYGANKVVTNYNIMGPVKAALEASAKYLAVDLGAKDIRVNIMSPGPIKTMAASGLSQFDELMIQAANKAPLHQLVTLDQIGAMAAFLVSDGSKQVTGQIFYVDAGYNIVGNGG